MAEFRFDMVRAIRGGLSRIAGAIGIALIAGTTIVAITAPKVALASETSSCSGSCIFSNGLCRDVDCSGAGCSCGGSDRTSCACR